MKLRKNGLNYLKIGMKNHRSKMPEGECIEKYLKDQLRLGKKFVYSKKRFNIVSST